jgi:hypothetical protein
MTATQSGAESWQARGREDAPIAQRAIVRAIFEGGKSSPGYACAYAIRRGVRTRSEAAHARSRQGAALRV